ncbi:MAG: nucleotide exchange factor GrpE [Spirobacillus cienkowskii]|jgi:molecular chaperone GrpE|uniref:Protein GrpE n=1 Tax=Spirobacillus cienkowskii TaxID=495820 RepID=A0A369KTY0_9BACT|nr:MAG: nucleotide exchange factor GrpE [Spirobacillus cienkowskii]
MFLRQKASFSAEEVSKEAKSEKKDSFNEEELGSDVSEAQGSSVSQKTENESKIAALEAEIATTQTKLAETHDRMLRIAADFDNTRKRQEKEKFDTRIYAIQEFAKDLLPVIDAFDKAMSAIEQSQINFETEEGKKVAGIVEGVGLVSKIFQDVVKKHGIEKLPGKDSPFNPAFHNAIAKVVDASVTQETVVDEFMAGYKIGERILRTAMVRVASPD